MRGLVALDLDGTLLGEDCAISPGHERAVREIRQLGFAVALATGRPLLSSRWVHGHLKLDTPLVCFNGGWVGWIDQPPFAWLPLSERQVNRILVELAAFPGSASCYPAADQWWMDRESDRTRGWADLYRVPIRFGDLTPWRGPSCKIMFVADPTIIPVAVAGLGAALGPGFQVVMSQPDRLEILPGGVTKAWGLERLAQRLGVPREKVWAVGDQHNDVEMVAWAGHGCSMGQAPHRLRAVARHLLPGVSARGLCALPELLARLG